MSESGSGGLGTVRQEAIDTLMEHFANDVLTVEEFERRVSLAHKAESLDELRELLTDLPSGDLPVLREEEESALVERAQPSVPASTRNQLGPPGARASTEYRSAKPPLLIHCFAPLIL